MDMSKLFAKNDNNSAAGAKDLAAIDSDKELDKAFNKPIVSEKLHLKEMNSGNIPLEKAMNKVNKKSLIVKAAGAAAAAAIIILLALVATDNLYRITGNLPENPRKAVEIVLNKMQEAKSMHMEGEMSVELDILSEVAKIPNKEKIKYSFSGDSELPDNNYFIIKVISSTVPQISKAETEIITIGKKGYVRFKDAPESESGEEWQDMDYASGGNAVAPVFDTSIASNKYLKYIKEVKLADKNGAASHYKITIDGEKIAASEEFEQLKKIYRSDIGEVEAVEDIWVDNKNKLINKNTAEISMSVKEGGEKVKIKNSVSLEFSDFGKTLAIKTPAKIKPSSGLAVAEFGLSGNDERRAIDLVIVNNALADYYKDNNKYPSTGSAMQRMNGENILSKELAAKYLPSLPFDPDDPKSFYGYKSDGNYYELTAALEDQNSSVCRPEGTRCIFKIRNGELASKK